MLRFAPVVCIVVVACGGSVSSVPDGPSDAGISTDGEVPVASCSSLAVRGAVQIVSDQPASSSLLRTVAGGAPGALVGWLATAPQGQPPTPLRVRAVDRNGVPTSAAHDVLSVLGGGGSLAWGYGKAGAIGADGNLDCQLVPLDSTGAPLGATHPVTMGQCGQLATTASGFDMLTTLNGDLSLASADGSGQPAGSVALEKGAVPATVLRATFADQSFMLAWTEELLSNCACPAPLSVQHFSGDGQPLAPKQTPASVFPGARFALMAEGDRAVLVTPGSLGGPLAVRAMAMDGTVIGAPLTLTGTGGGKPSALAVDVAGIGGNVAVVAWIESSGTTQAHVVAQAITTEPAILSQPVVVAPSGVGIDVKVVGYAARALVLWDGPLGGAPSQVSAAPVGCGP